MSVAISRILYTEPILTKCTPNMYFGAAYGLEKNLQNVRFVRYIVLYKKIIQLDTVFSLCRPNLYQQSRFFLPKMQDKLF